MDTVFIISPVVGSIIGYFTNWLAIKMLFRPLTKKEILGVKIPFTPGVIPRRRGKLADSIGAAVGKKLLTADAFEKMFQEKRTKSKVKGFIREKLELLAVEKRSLEQILKQVFSNDKVEELKQDLSKLIIRLIDSLITEKQINRLLDTLFVDLDQNKLEQYLTSEEYQQLKTNLLQDLDAKKIQQGLVSILQPILKESESSEKEIGDIIPAPIVNKIKECLANNESKLIEQITEFLTSDSVKEKIDERLDGLFGDNPLVSMLDGLKDSVVEKFLRYLVEFLDDPDNRQEIRRELNKFLDSILETELSTIVDNIDEEDIYQTTEKMADYLVEDSRIEMLINSLEKFVINNLSVDDLKIQLKRVINKLIDINLLITVIEKLVSRGLSSFFSQPLKLYFSKLPTTNSDKLETGIVNLIEYVMEHHLGKVLSDLDFEGMVKRKIDSFDILEVERLLLDVIETELEAITWFGAVLGFIMGLITPVISLLTV
ncbi:DUF445 family protein [Halanaerocella petrolearia]